MKKKDSIIYAVIVLVFFLFFIAGGINWISIIGMLSLILLLWACSKREEELAKKIADELAKKQEEQSSKIIEEPEAINRKNIGEE